MKQLRWMLLGIGAVGCGPSPSSKETDRFSQAVLALERTPVTPARITFGTMGASMNEVYLFGGTGSHTAIAPFSMNDQIALGDVDGSKVDQLITGRPSSGSILVYDDAGNQILWPNASSHYFRLGERLATGDLDGDGFDEIVYGQTPDTVSLNGELHVITRSGKVLDFFNSNSPSFGYGFDFAVCDLDGDGHSEIIRAPDWHIWSDPNNGKPQILLSDLFPGGLPSFLPGYDRIVCANFNDDNYDDLVLINPAQANDGGSMDEGTFSFFSLLNLPQAKQVVFNPVYKPAFQQHSEIAVGDVTGDSVAEMFIGHIHMWNSSSIPNSTDGTLRLYDAKGAPVAGFLPTWANVFYAWDSLAIGHTHPIACTPSSTSDATCDAIDDDCDGVLDEEYVELNTICGKGACKRNGKLTCVGGSAVDTCVAGSPTSSSDASCNGTDEDCDGSVDEDYPVTATTCGLGECVRNGSLTCKNGSVDNSCSAGTPSTETHDDKDNDCDGTIDDRNCNGIDNDNDGDIDEDPGACKYRFLMLPLCWSGTDASYEAAVDVQKTTFLASTGLSACSTQVWFQTVLPSQLNIPCNNSASPNLDDIEYAVQSAALAGITSELHTFDTFAALTDQDLNGDPRGETDGSGRLWGETTVIKTSYPDVTLAHEFGHILDLKDEYCSTLPAVNGGTRCNSPSSTNPLDAALGCDPLSSSCCSVAFRNPNSPAGSYPDDKTPCAGQYAVCCVGNSAVADATAPALTNDPTGRCVMGSTFGAAPRRFCQHCLDHLRGVGMQCSTPFSGQQRILLAKGTVGPNEFRLDSAQILESARFQLQSTSPRTTGDLVVQFSRVDTGAVLATRGLMLPRTGDSSDFGIDESVSLRMPLPNDVADDAKILITTSVGGTIVNSTTYNGEPPVAVLGNVTQECTSAAGAVVAMNGMSSYDPDADTIHYSWNAAAVVLTPGDSSSPTGTFPVGATNVTLTVADGTQMASSATATVSIVDTKPPVITVPAAVTRASCERSGLITVGQATAIDTCSTSVIVKGQVVATNGKTLTTPIDVVSGKVSLGVGIHTIRWTASDGKQSAEGTQVATVGTQIQSSRSFILESGASLRTTSGFAPLYNSGSGNAQVGNDGHAGDILSVGAVTVGHRSFAGNVLSATSVFVETDGHAGSQTVGPVVLPALPTLANFSVPSGTGFDVSGTRTVTPGSYEYVRANSGATIIFAGGDFYIGNLTINSSVTLRAAANTRIFVKTGLDFRSPFLKPSSSHLQPVYLGFTGTSATLEAPFTGTLLAPNATITFGVGSGQSFSGSFFAKVLWVRANSQLICVEP